MSDPGPKPRVREGRSSWANGGLLVASLLVSLVALECGARLIERQLIQSGDENPFARFTNEVPVFERVGRGGDAFYRRTRHHWISWPQSFRAIKRPSTFRVFSLGGSAAMGWPHPPEQSYAGILAAKLEQMYPDRGIEWLNVAGNTYASYRVKFVLEEVIEYDPDLVLLYTGNNEFLEQFVYRTEPEESSGRWALTRLVGRIRSQRKPVVDVANYGQADRLATRLSFAFGRGTRLREDPDQLEQVVAHYRYNLESMLEAASERGVPVLLLDVPINLKDWIPNVSIHAPGLDPAARERFEESFRAGLRRLESGDAEGAAAELEGAVAIDPGYAEAQYYLGVSKHRAGDLAGARAAYVEAVRSDAYPFRSLPRFDEVRRTLARRAGVWLVETTRALETHATDGILGLDVFVDYVHPRVAANEVIADAVLGAMDRAGLLPATPAIPWSEARASAPAGVEDTLQVLSGLHSQFLVMRQYDKLEDLSQRLLAAAQREARRRPEMRETSLAFQKRVRRIRAVVEPYRRLLRAEKMGVLEREFTKEQARAVYEDYVELVHRLEAGELGREEFEKFVPPLRYAEEG